MKEKAIVGKILTFCKTNPFIWARKIHGNAFQGAGIPDIIGHCKGIFFAMEVKQPGKHPTLLQQAVIEAINATGGRATVVTSLDEAKSFIQSLDPIDKSFLRG